MQQIPAGAAEEMIRANPIDGVVLLAGCDKTTPAQLMGAASADLPAIMVTGGPMLAGRIQPDAECVARRTAGGVSGKTGARR